MEFLHNFFAPTITSKQWRLNVHDWIRSLTMAILSGLLEMAYEMIKATAFSFSWSAVGHAVALATFTYLFKNFATSGVPKVEA